MSFPNCSLLNTKTVLLFFFCLTILAHIDPNHAYAWQSNEQKKLTKTEFLGDYSNATKKKTTGKISLAVWEPHIQKLQNAGFTGAIPPTRSMTIDYDEIWETKNTDGLTKQEIKNYWNDLDIMRFYWKDGNIQAAVVMKAYISNPISNQKFPKPEHKITYLSSRAEILAETK